MAIPEIEMRADANPWQLRPTVYNGMESANPKTNYKELY